MDHRVADEFRVDVCAQCGVMWFDPEELKRVLACEATAEAIDDHAPQRQRRVALFRGKALQCPRDRAELVLREHVDKPDVDIDQCPSCRGIMLEAGELRELAERSWRERSWRERVARWWSGQ